MRGGADACVGAAAGASGAGGAAGDSTGVMVGIVTGVIEGSSIAGVGAVRSIGAGDGAGGGVAGTAGECDMGGVATASRPIDWADASADTADGTAIADAGVAKSSSMTPDFPIAITPPQIEQRARTPA
ncbi:MAG TPA: hypothetical protein VJ672_02680 [Gemmatimonadaceae bacterium]|nr:hypothetical protein [Gemmatimonadaceae bacterium]